MAKNGYVTPREFETAITRLEKKTDDIDNKINALNNSFVELKTHFNDALVKSVRSEIQKTKFNLDVKKGIIIAIFSGIISFLVSWGLR